MNAEESAPHPAKLTILLPVYVHIRLRQRLSLTRHDNMHFCKLLSIRTRSCDLSEPMELIEIAQRPLYSSVLLRAVRCTSKYSLVNPLIHSSSPFDASNLNREAFHVFQHAEESSSIFSSHLQFI